MGLVRHKIDTCFILVTCKLMEKRLKYRHYHNATVLEPRIDKWICVLMDSSFAFTYNGQTISVEQLLNVGVFEINSFIFQFLRATFYGNNNS